MGTGIGRQRYLDPVTTTGGEVEFPTTGDSAHPRQAEAVIAPRTQQLQIIPHGEAVFYLEGEPAIGQASRHLGDEELAAARTIAQIIL